ncbi:MAG TPA: FlgD immunoglobulin-like domain containing protein [Candidatus Udaeobacter sp.]|jgi:hypothetical protein|nr:FlgD immunoglobulin-like domain containing protein [Candidatus Udaeobacter sp.]
MRRIFSLTVLAAFAIACGFSVAAARTSIDSLLITPTAQIDPSHPIVGDVVRISLNYCDPCADIDSVERISNTHFRVSLTQRSDIGPCSRLCPWPQTLFTVAGLTAGPQSVLVETVARDSSGSVGHSSLYVQFDVADAPQPSLPYIHEIRIGSPNPCTGVPVVCPNDSIPVTLLGSFPSDCYRIRRIDLIEPVFLVAPAPHPPFVRVLVDDMGCLERLCLRGDFPWKAEVKLPGLPPNAYGLDVIVGTSSCSDTFPSDSSVHSTTVPFTVVENCSTTVDLATRCLVPAWQHPNLGGCDDFVRSDHPANLTFDVRSSVPLSGLQGRFTLRGLDRAVRGTMPPTGSATALVITRIEPIGVASGMHVQWSPTADGARFLMFADAGAPIPAVPLDDTTAVPVLRVTAAPLDTGIVASVSGITALELLGSDEGGSGIEECASLCIRRDPFAYICNGSQGCDVNHDGALDVRDLVVMIHCVLSTGTCVDSSSAVFDCNGDGRVNLDDVLCCGGVILTGHLPDSTAARPEHGITAEFGDPVPSANGVDVPLALTGSHLFGAARLSLSFPTDRFDLAGAEVTGLDRTWLELHQPDAEGVLLGLIRIPSRVAPAVVTDGRVHVLLHFALRPGASAGGMVTLVGGDFSDPAGAALAVDLGAPVQALAEQPIGLSAMQPNPFSRETRFTIHLTRAAEVELEVHDLVGRRLATIHRGALPAGTRVFTWDGRGSSGDRAANGVYFVRLMTDGHVTARKVVLVRAP